MNWDALKDMIVENGLKIVIAFIILLVCFKIVNVLSKRLTKRLSDKEKIDKTTVRTLINIGKVLLKIIVVICLVGYLGIDTSGITALFTSLGVCFGLAVNGALANFAGGILLLFTRPFKVDDYIEACGYQGIVEDISIINTKLRTYDNKVIYIPNGTLSSDKIVNHYQKEIRRIDLNFDVDYSTDTEAAKSAALRAIKAIPGVLETPAPDSRVMEYKDSGICIMTRTWCASADYWNVYFDVIENVKKEFDKEGITVPFPQVDVHIKEK